MPNSAPPKTRFELFVELIKALAWPCLVLVLLLVFWTPLQQTASLVPSVIGRSDTITIAGLTLKVSQGLKAKASPEVESVLAKLSKNGIERLLEAGESSYWDRDSMQFGKDVNAELVKLGLLAEISDAELKENNRSSGRNHGYGVRRTNLGNETRAFLQSIVAEFVQEFARQGASK